ncbi:(2Fe-2S)-binding protein [Acidisoma silvae]|uniref:(2Fe-2S)-binding protein n=1 Tax=Acidisoma silvae TaxID=2802396 RepID=A0A963YVC7_9PROT|nr:(2Fe-2S)-binding protein [Acidisoma silvae]MCB8877821.1 (2Fe-2S)-binding protein [Acidisoma silvae]
MSLPDATRRTILGSAATLATLPAGLKAQAGEVDNHPEKFGLKSVILQVNGQQFSLDIEPRVSLLDALREYIGLTGTKKGCDHGACGACTVHINGRRIVSCLVLAARSEGKDVVTIEGLAHGDELHPVQAAFLHHDGFQCGYCTPGQIMSAVALLEEGHAGSADEIREWMSGNICRCGAYPNIVTAIQDASGQLSEKA